MVTDLLSHYLKLNISIGLTYLFYYVRHHHKYKEYIDIPIIHSDTNYFDNHKSKVVVIKYESLVLKNVVGEGSFGVVQRCGNKY